MTTNLSNQFQSSVKQDILFHPASFLKNSVSAHLNFILQILSITLKSLSVINCLLIQTKTAANLGSWLHDIQGILCIFFHGITFVLFIIYLPLQVSVAYFGIPRCKLCKGPIGGVKARQKLSMRALSPVDELKPDKTWS